MLDSFIERTPQIAQQDALDLIARRMDLTKAERNGFAASFVERDARDLAGVGPADLMTGFWYGYVHQDTLADVDRVLLGMAEATAPGGDLLLGVCDPGGFSRLPRDIPVAYGPSMRIDAVIWSYKEPEGWAHGAMIAPIPAASRPCSPRCSRRGGGSTIPVRPPRRTGAAGRCCCGGGTVAADGESGDGLRQPWRPMPRRSSSPPISRG